MNKYKEIFRLKEMMDKSGIPYTFNQNHFDGYHLMYPDKGDVVCSVVEFEGSYGYKEDRLEIQGLMTTEEKKETQDDVLGHLSAEDVFGRIAFHYLKESL